MRLNRKALKQVDCREAASSHPGVVIETLDSRMLLSANVTGNWQGTVSQNGGGATPAYTVTMQFIQTATSVSGTEDIAENGQPQYYADYTLAGTVTGNTFDFSDKSITKSNIQAGYYWLLVSASLQVPASGNSMTGPWSADGYSGTFNLTKVSAPAPLVAVKSAVLSGSTITFVYEATHFLQASENTTFALYQSARSSFDSTATQVPSEIRTVNVSANTSGSGKFNVSFTRIPSRPYLFVVSDPSNLRDPAAPTKSSLVVRPLAWGNVVSNAFREKEISVAEAIGTDPNYLMAAMAFETGGSFRAAQRSGSSNAVGLIQFLPSTAKSLGVTITQLASMTATAQLTYVQKYFTIKGYAGRVASLADLYMAILYPAAIGKALSYVVFSRAKDLQLYHANSGLDLNKDGVITKSEILQTIQAKLNAGFVAGKVFDVNDA